MKKCLIISHLTGKGLADHRRFVVYKNKITEMGYIPVDPILYVNEKQKINTEVNIEPMLKGCDCIAVFDNISNISQCKTMGFIFLNALIMKKPLISMSWDRIDYEENINLTD